MINQVVNCTHEQQSAVHKSAVAPDKSHAQVLFPRAQPVPKTWGTLIEPQDVDCTSMTWADLSKGNPGCEDSG